MILRSLVAKATEHLEMPTSHSSNRHDAQRVYAAWADRGQFTFLHPETVLIPAAQDRDFPH
jgi:hypothetical protein